jgi:transposase
MNPYPAINSILVLENAWVHTGGQIPELCSEAGVRIKYLPPYCPKLNPIELCFLVIKSHLRQTQVLAQTFNEVEEIYASAKKHITFQICDHLYRHAGYSCTEEPYDSTFYSD